MQDRNTLEYMHLHLNVETVDIVVDAILHASRLFVVGEGSVGYMAEGFALQLLILGLPAHAISGELTGPGVKKGAIRPGDVFLGLGLTAMTPGVSVMLKSHTPRRQKPSASWGRWRTPWQPSRNTSWWRRFKRRKACRRGLLWLVC